MPDSAVRIPSVQGRRFSSARRTRSHAMTWCPGRWRERSGSWSFPVSRTGRRQDAASPSFTPPGAGAWILVLLPALHQFVIVDGDGLFLLVLDLELRRKVALRDSILVPIFDIVLLREFRPDIALDSGALQTLQHLLLLGAERVHRLLGSLGTRRGIADCLPPELGE